MLEQLIEYASAKNSNRLHAQNYFKSYYGRWFAFFYFEETPKKLLLLRTFSLIEKTFDILKFILYVDTRRRKKKKRITFKGLTPISWLTRFFTISAKQLCFNFYHLLPFNFKLSSSMCALFFRSLSCADMQASSLLNRRITSRAFDCLPILSPHSALPSAPLSPR